MNINLVKPNKKNLNTFVTLGSVLILIGFFDFLANTFLDLNFTRFLPDGLSFLTPIIFGVIGLHFIRIEFSGNRLLDKINTNFNSSNFNAFLSLLVIFALIKYIPPILNWFIFDADFAGNTKQDCASDGACWVFVKVLLILQAEFAKVSSNALLTSDYVRIRELKCQRSVYLVLQIFHA